MSDDTPTQRFDSAGAPDAPTEMLTNPPTSPPPGDASAVPGDARSKRTIIILLAVGGALLLGVLILLIVLLLRGGSTPPSPSPTPTESSATPSPTPPPTSPTPTPTPTPTQTVDPPPPSPISTFTASDDSVNCDGVSAVTVQFSWAATGETLWFGVGTDNAKAEPYDTYPLNYTLDFDYQCGQPSGQRIPEQQVRAETGEHLGRQMVECETQVVERQGESCG